MSFFNTIRYILNHATHFAHFSANLNFHIFLLMKFLSILGSRTMTRGQRGPKRTTPAPSATSSPTTEMPPPAPVAPLSVVPAVAKPLYLCSPFVEAALVKGNFKTIVMLPKYVDIMEWVAVNSTYLFYLFAEKFVNNTPWSYSIRLLYKLERVLWCYNGMLYTSSLSYYVCWPDVRVLSFIFHSRCQKCIPWK